MGLERWWDRKSRKPECRTKTNESSVTHRETRSQARRQELRLCKKNVHGRQGAQQDLKRPSQRQLAT